MAHEARSPQADEPAPRFCPNFDLPLEEILARNAERGGATTSQSAQPYYSCSMIEIDIDPDGNPR